MGSSAINLSGPLGPEQFRNQLLNGDFNFWQRGTEITTGPDSGSYSTGTGKVYVPDRWFVRASLGRGISGAFGGDGKEASVPRIKVERQGFTVGYPQLTDVSASDYFCRITVGAADGTAIAGVTGASMDLGNSNMHFVQLTDVNTSEFSDATCYLSFLGKSFGDITNPTIGCRLSFDPDQSDDIEGDVCPDTTGVTASLSTGFRETIKILGDDIELSPSWQKFKRKFKFPSFEGCTLGDVSTIHTTFTLAAGASGAEELRSNGKLTDMLGLTGLTGAVEIAQVQMEIGDDSSPFEKRHPAVELGVCQRYYFRDDDLRFYVDATQNHGMNDQGTVIFPTTMRTTPSVSIVTENIALQTALACPSGVSLTVAQSTIGEEDTSMVGLIADAEL